MAIPQPNPRSGALSGIARKGMFLLSALAFGSLFPLLVLWGGSTNLINWGPGLLIAGVACLLLLDKDRLALRGGGLHTTGFLLLLGLLFVRARYSPDVAASANNSSLIGFAAVGFLIGRLANETKSRALFIGLSLVAMLNFFCSVMQMKNPEWNLIYPQRSGGLPSGLFAHYSYSAAFCLGSAGLLISHAVRERTWLKVVLIGGAICALVTIPISLSRGGNLALALMAAVAISLVLARAFWKSRSLMSTWLPAIALLALLVIFGAFFVPLIGRNTGAGEFYIDGCRIEFWNAAVQIAANHPWLGGGPGSFAWNVFHVMDGLTVEPGMTHNEALQLVVDFGYPALIGMAAIILVPVILCFWRFVNKTGTANASWAAIGLLGMLMQSNFESIFHTGPGAFVAALILGQISRSLWAMENADACKSTCNGNDSAHPDPRFFSAVKAHVDHFSAGDAEAVPKLVGLLSQSKDDQWRRGSNRLLYWTKAHNEEALRKAMENLGTAASEELGRLSSARHPREEERISSDHPRQWRVLGNLTITTCALAIMFSGARLSQALADAWVPLYHPQRTTAQDGFEQLISVAENNPGLGIDRKVLSAARDCIYRCGSQEAREDWATAHRKQILRAIPGWRTDPGAALQIAEIIGWVGTVNPALSFYNHAIASQGDNETLFMACSFKGQYLYELSISAGAAGKASEQEFYARQAVECFKEATASLATNKHTLSPFFRKMLVECEAFGKNGISSR